MSYQPSDSDEIICYYNHDEFSDIDANVKLHIYSQADNNALIDSDSSDPSSPPNTSSALNDLNDISNENCRSADDLLLEDVFPDAILGGVSVLDPPDDLPDMDTITSPTPTSLFETSSEVLGAENSALPETNSMTNVDESTTEDVIEQINLNSVPIHIQNQLMSVSVHPTQNPRRRYAREGKRRIKKIDNSDLMTIDISKLKKYKLNANQSLVLRLSLISVNTDDNNPLDNVRIHPDKLRCFSRLIRINLPNDGSIYIRIRQSDIDKGSIKLKDLSIIKTKYQKYDFKLISYSLLEISDEFETYAIDPKKRTAGNAKIFRQRFTLNTSRIACQILIEEDQSFHLTHIACATHVMIEQEYAPKKKKPVKRSGKKRRNTKKNRS